MDEVVVGGSRLAAPARPRNRAPASALAEEVRPPLGSPSPLSDRLLLVIVTAAPALAYLAAFTLDTRRTFIDANYATVVVTEGRAVVVAQVLAMAVGGTLAAHILLRGLLSGRQPLTWLAVPGLIITAFTILRGNLEVGHVLGLLVGVVVLLAAPAVRLDRPAMAALGVYALGFVAVVWMVALAMPGDAIKVCRPDKCGLVGGLLQSFMGHEQVLGLYVAFLVPALAFLRRPLFVLGLVVHLATVAATGSRTAALTVVVTTSIAVILHYPPTRLVVIRRQVLILGAVVPAVATGVSLVTFLAMEAASLTDRGAIWELIRSRLNGTDVLTGPGGGMFEEAFRRSETTWQIPHAHNQVANLLVEGGLLALAPFVVGVVLLAVAGVMLRAPGIAAFAVGPALSFGTEIVWNYNYLSSFMWTLFITIALMASHIRGPLSSSAPVREGQ